MVLGIRAAAVLAAVVASGLSSTGSTQTRAAHAPRPVEQFAELPSLVGPKMSPNGKLVAGQFAQGGKQYLAIFPADGDTSKTRFIHTGNNDLNWWRWVNDDWLVIGVGDRVPVDGQDWYVRRAMSVSATGTKVLPLMTNGAAQAADDVIWVANDGTPRILLALQKSIYTDNAGFWPSVYEVDVSTGKSKLAVGSRDGVMDWSADAEGTVRMGIGHSLDGRTMRVLYRDTPDARFKEIVRGAKRGDGVILPTLFLPDRTKALAFADDEAGYTALYEYDLMKLEKGKQLYHSTGFDLAGLIANERGDGLAAIRHYEDVAHTEWLDPDLVALDQEIGAHVKGGQARLVDVSRDHASAVVFVGANNSPGAYFIYERKSGEMRLFAFGNNSIRMARLNPVRTIRYKARDGLEIAAILTLPRGKSGKAPLIVLPHGGPFARDGEEWDWWSQYLAERGYAVVQPNYRGSSGYGTPFTLKGQGQWGNAMQDDLIDAVAYLAKEGIADPKRVCIVGASYGGYAAMRAAQRDAATYRCAISYAGVSDLNRMLRYDSRFLASAARMDWLRLQATDLKAVSPLTSPEKSMIPLLLVHGKADTVVPVDQSRELAERLRRAGKDVTYIEQKEGDHHFSRAEDRLEFLKAMQAFLDKHNPA